MSKRVLAAVMLAIAGALFFGGGVAAGCGDKFVLLGRGARFARAKHPSSILIYMRPGSRVPAAEKEFRLEASLKAAGHRPHVAESESEVRQEIESGKYDLVLADFRDVSDLRRQAGAISSKPSILPLLYEPTAEELASAEKDASCSARPSNKTRDLITVIDETMQNRLKGNASKCATGP
jgi:hypothetical protein